jgi:hypothetical protein
LSPWFFEIKIAVTITFFIFFVFIVPKREERTPFVAAGLHCRSVVRRLFSSSRALEAERGMI